jgi:hypothetical protein
VDVLAVVQDEHEPPRPEVCNNGRGGFAPAAEPDGCGDDVGHLDRVIGTGEIGKGQTLTERS